MGGSDSGRDQRCNGIHRQEIVICERRCYAGITPRPGTNMSPFLDGVRVKFNPGMKPTRSYAVMSFAVRDRALNRGQDDGERAGVNLPHRPPVEVFDVRADAEGVFARPAGWGLNSRSHAGGDGADWIRMQCREVFGDQGHFLCYFTQGANHPALDFSQFLARQYRRCRCVNQIH